MGKVGLGGIGVMTPIGGLLFIAGWIAAGSEFSANNFIFSFGHKQAPDSAFRNILSLFVWLTG
jgi:hypothetical protein